MTLSLLALAAISASHLDSGLRAEADRIKLNLGTCVRPDVLRANGDEGHYEAGLVRNFNLIEPENDLKPPALWMGIGKYNFTNADFLVGADGAKGWAESHHIKVRGHVLVYARDDGYTIPRWLLQMESQITTDQAKTILHDYIHAVAGRYKGKISMWDVANEAIDDKPNSNPYNLRNSFWFRKLGPEFLVLAFRYAHEADPKAELYYNEYGMEGGGEKTEHLLALVDYLRKEHAPITGVGLQYHTWLANAVVPGDGHYKLLDEIKRRDLKFMITELDLGIDVQPFPRNSPQFGTVVRRKEDLDLQAERYEQIFRMALSYPNCHGIQMWGFTDRHSWIPEFQMGKGAPLILDADYQPKPAYEAISKVLAKR